MEVNNSEEGNLAKENNEQEKKRVIKQDTQVLLSEERKEKKENETNFTSNQTHSADNEGTDSSNLSGNTNSNRGISLFRSAVKKNMDILRNESEMAPKMSASGSMWNRITTTLDASNAFKEGIMGSKSRRRVSEAPDPFMIKFSTRTRTSVNDHDPEQFDALEGSDVKEPFHKKWLVNPDEQFLMLWQGIVTISVLYNLWTMIIREAYTELLNWNFVWLSLDYSCDGIYISDMFVQARTGFLEQGLLVWEWRKTFHKYLKSSNFVFDILSLLPLDLIQCFIGIHPIVRLPRLLKVYRAYTFMQRVGSRTAHPNIWRITNLTHILLVCVHWLAAFYYMMSMAGQFKGEWVYPNPVGEFATFSRKYLRCFYWSVLTLTTIGDLPAPETNFQYMFTTFAYLLGVFLFATVVGQIGNLITNRNASRMEFERLLDGAKMYMREHNVPLEMQRRVQRWYDYSWARGRMKTGGDATSLELLPDKLKTELALHVNLKVLKKVTIFQQCQPEFLHDLVLKMRAYIFTPGDLVCRKGEVAKEMFIIADGLLEVISHETGKVLSLMRGGDFFGEIGILSMEGGANRRTADVRSVGYVELFVLSRADVLHALEDHPQAERILKEYGRKRLQEKVAQEQLINGSNYSLRKPLRKLSEEVAEKNDSKQLSSSDDIYTSLDPSFLSNLAKDFITAVNKSTSSLQANAQYWENECIQRDQRIKEMEEKIQSIQKRLLKSQTVGQMDFPAGVPKLPEVK